MTPFTTARCTRPDCSYTATAGSRRTADLMIQDHLRIDHAPQGDAPDEPDDSNRT